MALPLPLIAVHRTHRVNSRLLEKETPPGAWGLSNLEGSTLRVACKGDSGQRQVVCWD